MIRTDLLDRAFDALPATLREAHPCCALVLGSGWNRALDGLDVAARIAYGDLPGLGAAAVPGHDGALALVRLPSPHGAGATALAFCGRRHWYECQSWEPVVFPADFCRRLGVPEIILTNAAGGINPAFRPGDVVLIRDHLRLSYLNPLQGPHNPLYGPRFPDQTHVYGGETADRLRRAAAATHVPLHEGVYAFSCGPTFETPAEVRAYGILGADLVGMSTVPEAIVASACGIRVGALSLVTNPAAGLGDAALRHEDVVEAAHTSGERIAALLVAYLAEVAAS